MSQEIYTTAQREFQDSFDSRRLADALAMIRTAELDDHQRGFISSRDFFFLATVDSGGMPTVSYKGGAPGFIAVDDATTLLFPSYDGNGMFLSIGNIADTAAIGMLFIDFETPNRLRVQATATVSDDPALLQRWPGADLVVRAEVTAAFGNCARYIHPHSRVATSKYVPDDDGNAPVPSWKRIDLLQGSLPADPPGTQPPGDAGDDIIDIEEYQRRVDAGDS